MNTGPPIVLDGRLREDGRIEVLADGGALHHGVGVFETLQWVPAGRPRFAERHARRIANAARELGASAPPALATWLADLDLLAGRCGPDPQVARWMCLSDGDAWRRVVSARPFPDRPPPARIALLDGADPHRRSLPAIKSFNWLGPRRALELVSEDCEPVYTGPRGKLLEGARANLFLVVGGVLHTAAVSDGVLPGVGREVVLEAAAELGIPVVREAPAPALARACTEVFLVSSLRGVMPIADLEGRGLAAPGPITALLARRFDPQASGGAGP